MEHKTKTWKKVVVCGIYLLVIAVVLFIGDCFSNTMTANYDINDIKSYFYYYKEGKMILMINDDYAICINTKTDGNSFYDYNIQDNYLLLTKDDDVEKCLILKNGLIFENKYYSKISKEDVVYEKNV